MMTKNGHFTVLLIIILFQYGLTISSNNMTWEDAVKMCQENNYVIEDRIDRIKNVSLPAGTHSWLPKYSATTPWIDLIGCFNTETLKPYREVNAKSLGYCQHLCSKETYFGFNLQQRKCVCVSNGTLENQIENMSCKNFNSYKVHKVTDNNYEALDLGLCKKGRCKSNFPNHPNYIPVDSTVTKCVINSYGIASFCRNGKSFSYSNIQNEVSKECESSRYNSFLPNMLNKFCEKYGSVAQNYFWLSKFRLLYNGTQNIKDPKPVPVSLIGCSYGYFTDGKYSEDVDSCLSIKSVICSYDKKDISASTPSNEKTSSKSVNNMSPATPSNAKSQYTPLNGKSSSTPSNEKSSSIPLNVKSSSTEFDYPLMTTHTSSYPGSVKLTGTITGCVIGVIIITATVIMVIVCRRSTKKKRRTKENIPVHFTAETHGHDGDCDNQNIKEHPSLPSYGIDTDTTSHLYAKVNKRKDKPKEYSQGNMFSEACNGEYDHLNNLRKQEIIHTENTYDSHEGMRSSDDFTYDSSDFGRRQLDDKNDVYDHAYPTTRTDEDYDCSTNVMTKRIIESGVYMDK